MENHDKTLREVLSKLCEEGVTNNASKSMFGCTEIEFLGSVLTSKGVTISPKRVESINDFPVPTNKKKL